MSNIMEIPVDSIAPSLTVPEHGHSWALLRWTGVENSDVQYELDVLREGHGEWITARSDIRAALCRKRNLDSNTRYQFRVRLCTRTHHSPYSNVVTITTTLLDGFLDNARKQCLLHSIQHLPSPAALLQPRQIVVRRAEVLEDTVANISLDMSIMWAPQLVIGFIGEAGSDYGALHREWLVRGAHWHAYTIAL